MSILYLTNGKIVLPDQIIEDHVVQIAEGKIAAIMEQTAFLQLCTEQAEVLDLAGGYICPGWIDIHCHGAMGYDIMDGDPEGVLRMSRFKATHGEIGFIPTGITNPFSVMEKAIQSVADAAQRNSDGAQILGFHMEGPFINVEKKGAHREECIIPADAEWTRKVRQMVPGRLIVAIAPEVPGNLEYIRAMAEEGVLIATAHTNATYEEIKAAYEAGATHCIHTFNAMRELHHREPGVVGAIMDLPIIGEVILDGIHVHPVVVRILSRLKLPDKLVLVTDSLRAAGLEDGDYDLGGLKVIKRGNELRLVDGTLAGSTMTLDDAVRNAVNLVGLKLTDAVRMASTTPANLLGLGERKGSITVGKDADLALLTPDLIVRETIIGGRIVYRK